MPDRSLNLTDAPDPLLAAVMQEALEDTIAVARLMGAARRVVRLWESYNIVAGARPGWQALAELSASLAALEARGGASDEEGGDQ